MRGMMAVVCVALAACGSGSETDLETAFCDILANGPEDQVDAVDGPSGPELAAEDRSVAVLLVDLGDGTFGGSATYTADEAGSFVMGLSDDIPLTVYDSQDEVVPLENTVQGASCDELAVRHTVQLEAAAYRVEFGPTDVDEVRVVSEESDDDA